MRTTMTMGRYSRRAAIGLGLLLGAGLAACASGSLRAASDRPHPGSGGGPERTPVAGGPSATESAPWPAHLQPGEGWRAAPPSQPTALPSMPAPVVLVWQADGGTDRLRLPSGLAVARDGTVTVVDAGNNRLVRLSGSGQVLARLGRTGQAHGEFLFTTPPDVGEGAAFGLVGGGVAVDGEGGFFVTDYNARVQRFDRDGQFVTAWGDRPPTVGRFIEPFAVAVADRQGRVYVADRLAHCIHAFDRDGRWLLAWGELGTAGGQFIGPVAVAVDRQGQVYVADRGNDRIQTFDGNGRFLTAWGGPGRQPGEFAGPVGVAVDGQGHVFVATAHKILVFSATGIFLSAWDDTSVAGSFVAGGIAVDQHGDIYVTDAARGSILRFRPRGPWPTPSAAHPTPRPAMPTATPPPPMSPTPPPFMTPTDR